MQTNKQNCRSIKRGNQTGFVLLEALFGILIFSIGVLGIVALQAKAVQYSSDSRYRTEASLLVDELIGQLTVADPSNFSTVTSDWVKDRLTKAGSGLPGAVIAGPTVTTGAAGTSVVAVTLTWQTPGASESQSYTSSALIF